MEFHFSAGQDSKQNKDVYVKEIRRKRTSKIVVEMTDHLNNLFSISLAAANAFMTKDSCNDISLSLSRTL